MSEPGQPPVHASVSGLNQQVVDEFRANQGKVGGPFEGTPMILVHHLGAQSGAERVTPLVHFPEDGGTTLVVASNAGHPKHPAWFHNVRANPRFEVEVGAERYTVQAKQLPDEERDRLWERIVAEAPYFADYQERTERRIPVLRLTRMP